MIDKVSSILGALITYFICFLEKYDLFVLVE